MSLNNVAGCCDLNLSAESKNLKELVLEALRLGYQTVAINTTVSDQQETQRKKEKGGGNKLADEYHVPPPTRVSITPAELKQCGITRPPCILTRLTIFYTNPSKPFLNKAKPAIDQYDLVAITPLSDEALKQVAKTLMFVDIISLEVSEHGPKLARKLLKLAVQRDIYFELKYSPLIGSGSPSLRQNTIRLGYKLADFIRSHNVFISSGASSADPLRAPWDVANLARLLGLSLGAAHSAVTLMCHDLLHCARQRRNEANKCNAIISLVHCDSSSSLQQNKTKRKIDESEQATSDNLCKNKLKKSKLNKIS